MSELILRIFGTPSEKLKALMLDVDADDVKAAATALGIEKAANGKTVARASRYDLALEILKVERSIIDEVVNPQEDEVTGTEAEPEVQDEAGTETPSVIEATDPEAEPETKPRTKCPLQAQYIAVSKAKAVYEAEQATLKKLIDKRAGERKLTHHELLMKVKKSRQNN